jgi:glycosyltransferase involved in cell wall biosynthesis
MNAAVIIPVSSDPEGLRQTLALLDGQRVIVVVDGAHAPTEEVGRAAGADVVVLDTPSGSYAARNAGIDRLPADADVVLFTDAGCLPRPGWVAAHVAALASADLSGGAVDVTHGPTPTPAEWVDRCRNLRQQSYVEDGGYAATCNLAVRRAVLDTHRFDARLRSGGDREFCQRVVRDGAVLRYTADAAVAHPARSTGRQVLAKARRVGRGLASLPESARATPPAARRPNRGLARRAREADLAVGPWWTVRVAWLDFRRARVLRAEALRPATVVGLHVVVLMASRWEGLEHMSTRWRRIVESWSKRDDISLLTVVDHPWFRRSGLWRRPLVMRAESWLADVQLVQLTVPTAMSPSAFDRMAWRLAGRALRRSWPEAERRLIVATSPLVAPLLEHLGARSTVHAFDEVDLWYRSQVPGALGQRIADGFEAVAHAQVATSVSPPIAEQYQRRYGLAATVVRNGVDVELYEQADGELPLSLPDEPFALYVGSLSSRLDVDLVVEVADLLADEVTVVLAGPADGETAARLGSSAITWLGPVSADLVPGLLARAAVALFPHRATEHTEAIDSMKMLEYLAARVPIVSTVLPGVPDGVVTADGPQAFAAAVRDAVGQPRATQRHPAVATWDDVAERVLLALTGAGRQ